ncbi:MAG: lytic transglycosylase domain-containing protein [Paludibacterium sp.]|uniref:lytic transglycosylase domain-containing protein n=1 Tax=Paludibacterium sp. TaxID=1917523 RepID=UPI0025F402BA|nr:lytic transglycosylase domain-containing protein [Paludibacterium sp.]MBV8047788.1 lytic transglycosylase domain-containing protein [Paludibacterium sp.]MBV8645781.1 lytic transglycosylase domain-containing protein [Paludibacterium sp.]
MGRYALLLCLALFARPALAGCWQEAGSRYQIDPWLLWSIAKVESGFNPRAIHRNRDGSYDIGLMQINSRHLPRLARYGYDERLLLDNPCASVMVGGWILAGFMRQYGDGWRAIGAYNAGTAPGRDRLRDAYAQKVWRVYLATRARTFRDESN